MDDLASTIPMGNGSGLKMFVGRGVSVLFLSSIVHCISLTKAFGITSFAGCVPQLD